ncbi:MAG TPA: MarR family transcriptional regulator [Candidatus Thermoplasmatota archaeon]|nr:MarR family transcriptional regulator [Candidatus Thermoplasmatota archaeon]
MGNKSKYSRIFFPLTVLVIITLSLAPSLQAEDYYADLTITVDFSGFVNIGGLTNYPNLTTQNTEKYTSKQQSHWLLNITKTEMFSDFVYVLTLPKGSSISYIKSSGSIRIEESLGNLIVRGFGENESLSIIIQYQIQKTDNALFQENIVYLFLFPAIIFVSVILFILFLKEKKNRGIHTKVEKKEPLQEIKGLNHRQKQIMQLLHERNTPFTQTDIQKELQIPKASVSRNVRGLERRGLIEKEQIGMSNLIRLKKP